ncbi:zinc ribbon domain-containing protein [Ktedonobacter racemifer]|uniref:Zinc-ribbon domain-containing protein n=1 Tax=Ktedonobacter racemifer DSM 44963 TaxID=485913 RepID=D6TRL9_KTERA|nr:zinc ribbon domain-containing protein [Ktedonobacter racemifer]EFH85971.1 hypothetical protein Krac_7235 [Ktedonobacter racemifer DSM 44963]
MVQQPGRSCPSCGSPLGAGQRFCSNCGSIVEEDINKPTERTPGELQYRELQHEATQWSSPTPTPPPPPPSQGPAISQQAYERPMNYQPVPSYAQAQPSSSGKALRQIGCGTVLILLVILSLCGGAGYLGFQWIKGAVTSASRSTPSTYNSNGSSSDNSGTSGGSVITTTLNTKAVTYASVSINIVNAQQANSLPGDENGNQTGLLRLNLKEDNTSSKGSYYYYGDVAHLILPGGNSIAPGNMQKSSGPDASTKRDNWLDFPVATNIKPDQLTLRLGKSTEAQIDIPLKSDADVTKYQPTTITPNKHVQYADVTWTITSATLQMSFQSKQADNGKRFVVLKLRMDNTSSKTFIGYDGDYMRLQSGDTTSPPDGDSDVPTSIDSNQSNVTGTAAFMIPDGNPNCTFILLNTPSTGSVPQQTIDLQFK